MYKDRSELPQVHGLKSITPDRQCKIEDRRRLNLESFSPYGLASWTRDVKMKGRRLNCTTALLVSCAKDIPRSTGLAGSLSAEISLARFCGAVKKAWH